MFGKPVGCMVILLLVLLLVFTCISAGQEDGFTFEAFDTGDSPLWIIGLSLFLLIAVMIGISFGEFLDRHGIL